MHAATTASDVVAVRGATAITAPPRPRGGWEELVAFMTGGRGGPSGDPRQFKAHALRAPAARSGGPGGRARRRGAVAAVAPAAATSAPPCSCSSRSSAQNGYQLIQEIERRTEGVWKPSPGSVYPALQQLEDEGLVQAAEYRGQARLRRSRPRGASTSTPTARNSATRSRPPPAAWTRASWTSRGLMFQVGAAAMQVAAAGHTDDGSQDPRRHPPSALQDPRRGRPGRRRLASESGARGSALCAGPASVASLGDQSP